MAAEVMGIITGPYGGASRDLRAGGLSYQSSYTAHGGMVSTLTTSTCPLPAPETGADGPVTETYETYKKATTAELKPDRVGEGFLGKCI